MNITFEPCVKVQNENRKIVMISLGGRPRLELFDFATPVSDQVATQFPGTKCAHRGNFRTQEPGLHNKITGLHPYTCIVHLSTCVHVYKQHYPVYYRVYTRDMHVCMCDMHVTFSPSFF
jgi:hypothetical protein